MLKVNIEVLQEQANRLSIQRTKMSEIEERLGVICQRLGAASSEMELQQNMIEQKRAALRREMDGMSQCISVLRKSAEEYRRCEEQLVSNAETGQMAGSSASDSNGTVTLAGQAIHIESELCPWTGPVILPGVSAYTLFRQQLIWSQMLIPRQRRLPLRPVIGWRWLQPVRPPRLHPRFGPGAPRRRFRPARQQPHLWIGPGSIPWYRLIPTRPPSNPFSVIRLADLTTVCSTLIQPMLR